MDNTEFKIGDVVRLKSGGPAMTLTFILPNKELQCYWYSQTKEAYISFSFDGSILELSIPDKYPLPSK